MMCQHFCVLHLNLCVFEGVSVNCKDGQKEERNKEVKYKRFKRSTHFYEADKVKREQLLQVNRV